MLHITATLNYRTPADEEPTARVLGVHDSAAAARAAIPVWIRGAHVLPVTCAGTSRLPRVGDTLPTMREGGSLVAVVLPLQGEVRS